MGVKFFSEEQKSVPVHCIAATRMDLQDLEDMVTDLRARIRHAETLRWAQDLSREHSG